MWLSGVKIQFGGGLPRFELGPRLYPECVDKLATRNLMLETCFLREAGLFCLVVFAQRRVCPADLLGKQKRFVCQVKNSFRGMLKIPSEEISLGTAGQTLGKHWASTRQTLGVRSCLGQKPLRNPENLKKIQKMTQSRGSFGQCISSHMPAALGNERAPNVRACAR